MTVGILNSTCTMANFKQVVPQLALCIGVQQHCVVCYLMCEHDV